ncbi:MAG: hypothetical protein J6S76_06195 [Clostridia bacterium]|nr:hypothetical protein [Clostridia bacterium]
MRMEPIEKWIWLPQDQYPHLQKTPLTVYEEEVNYAVVEIAKDFRLESPIRSVALRFSADTAFILEVNDRHIATGPSSIGGDFLFNERVYPQQYATELELTPSDMDTLSSGALTFRALVRMQPRRMFEISHGHGGFFLTAHVTLGDGTKTVLMTDETWDIRYLEQYQPSMYDGRKQPHEWTKAQIIPNIWHCLTSPLEPCTEHIVAPKNNLITIAPGETVECVLELDKIYACYFLLDVKTTGLLHCWVTGSETGELGSAEEYYFTENTNLRGFDMHSAGALIVKAVNEGDSIATIRPAVLASHYPVHTRARTVTSDSDLNLIVDVCTHTLQYCRQTLHLDSPRHCEPLACTGDYYIASLMTQFTFGDQTLSAFDVRRTAQLLRYHDGRMFHTTYSLIWVQMLWDVYMLTGDTALLEDCEDALHILLTRFHSYLGSNGLIETPPDYMFIDWLYPDGINLHHPPKALGQTCMNLYYYGALKTAVRICGVLNEIGMKNQYQTRMQQLQKAACSLLFDTERGLFFEGLNTPTPEHLVGTLMPQNVEKRYYRQHGNILAAYFGIFDKSICQSILHKVMTDSTLGDIQPYFTHFLLDALYRNDLHETYTKAVLEKWIAPCKECSKGLVEGFILPQQGYQFDHSHAWGGTPAYALPLALSGLQIAEPGYKKISLAPNLLGLAHAHVEIPTPHGMICLDMTQGDNGAQINTLHVPSEITVINSFHNEKEITSC